MGLWWTCAGVYGSFHKWGTSNVLKTMPSAIPKITSNRWLKLFPNGWFIIVLTTSIGKRWDVHIIFVQRGRWFIPWLIRLQHVLTKVLPRIDIYIYTEWENMGITGQNIGFPKGCRHILYICIYNMYIYIFILYILNIYIYLCIYI